LEGGRCTRRERHRGRCTPIPKGTPRSRRPEPVVMIAPPPLEIRPPPAIDRECSMGTATKGAVKWALDRIAALELEAAHLRQLIQVFVAKTTRGERHMNIATLIVAAALAIFGSVQLAEAQTASVNITHQAPATADKATSISVEFGQGAGCVESPAPGCSSYA